MISLSLSLSPSLSPLLPLNPRAELTPPILNCALTTESAAFLSTEETSLALLAWEAPTSVRSDAGTAEAKEVEAIVWLFFRLLLLVLKETRKPRPSGSSEQRALTCRWNKIRIE